MKKNIIYGLGIGIIFCIAVWIGYQLYSGNKEMEEKVVQTEENGVEDKLSTENTVENKVEEQVMPSNAEEEKTTPNTQLVLEKVYQECGHAIKEYAEIPKEAVNLTKQELENQYEGWKISEFSKGKVILQKEVQGQCNQHYLLREEEGNIAVYEVQKDGSERLKEKTNIATEYLTSTDLQKIQEGIKVYGIEQLNSVLEDFE